MTDLRDQISDIIETQPVALFMKGTPSFVACGNSQRALSALRAAGAPVTAVDILPDPRFRQELSNLSGWPTSRRWRSTRCSGRSARRSRCGRAPG